MWNTIIDTYDNYLGLYGESSPIAPIAHTRIIARIGIMLDYKSNILAAAKIHQSIFAPCTAQSECRSRNIAPHLIHDNLGYVAKKGKKHDAYMAQLEDYVKNTDDCGLCDIVLKYLKKNTIKNNLSIMLDTEDEKNSNLVVTFGIKGTKECTVDLDWTNYYLSTLPKNGFCGIAGKSDYIPNAYPSNIRYPGDMAKLFVSNSKDKLNGMPNIRVGYIASQKICHTLQFLNGGWEDQGELRLEDISLIRC